MYPYEFVHGRNKKSIDSSVEQERNYMSIGV
jgi:hypothetical protein